MQASRSSADAAKVDEPITDGLNTDLHLYIGNEYRWKRQINSVIQEICWMQMEDVIQQ